MRKSIVLFLLVSCGSAVAQKSTYKGFPSLIWPKLYEITFVKDRDNLGEYDKPVFTATVKALANKRIILPGYMVPLENMTDAFKIMLSSVPLNACFFCGIGGPETAVEVNLKTKTPYIDKPVEVRGILRLNGADPDRMIYILDDAEILGTLDP